MRVLLTNLLAKGGLTFSLASSMPPPKAWCNLPTIHILWNWSEKRCEQHSDREFDRYLEGKMVRKPLFVGPEDYAERALEAFRSVSQYEFSETR